MVKMSQGAKERFSAVVNGYKFVFHWGFIPAVIYLGFKKGADPGMPPLGLLNLLWM